MASREQVIYMGNILKQNNQNRLYIELQQNSSDTYKSIKVP